jgi:type IV pilus assembly protein PilB
MADEISNPLLSLIRRQGLIDDLQYEEVVGELKRSGTPVIQLLQDFGIMKLPDILNVVAVALGTEVVSLRDREIPAEVIQTISPKVAQMYACLPVGLKDGVLQVALAQPLDPGKADEIHFAAKRDVQVVVADPAEIERGIEQYYGQAESESFSEILKEIDANKTIVEKVSAAADDDQGGGGAGQRGADCKICQSGFAAGGAGPRERHSL